jgi:hypothetical protein
MLNHLTKLCTYVCAGLFLWISSIISFASSLDTKIDRFDKQIAMLIYEMPNNEISQKNSIQQLTALGQQAIPYLIKYMNDYRPLPSDHIVPVFPSDMPKNPMPVENVNQIITLFLEGYTGIDIPNYRYDFEVSNSEELGINKWRKWCVIEYPDKKDICLNSKNGVPEVVLPQKLK